jgi:hypothetical protein
MPSPSLFLESSSFFIFRVREINCMPVCLFILPGNSLLGKPYGTGLSLQLSCTQGKRP